MSYIHNILTVVAVFLLMVSVSFAQTVDCPITELPYITVSGGDQVSLVTEAWNGQVTIVNPSSAIIPDVRIGVGLFMKDDNTTPRYWHTLPDAYTLRPSANQVVNVDLGTEYVPPGEYHLQFYVAQGDDFAPLGNALQGVAASAVTVKKEILPSTLITSTLTVSGGVVDETSVSPLQIQSVFQNSSVDTPFRDRIFELRVGKNNAPVGSAVQFRQDEAVRILPEKSQTLSFVADFLEPGLYTTVGLLRGGNDLLPVVITRTTLGDSRSYYVPVSIAAYGMTGYPLGEESVEAFMCVQPVVGAEPVADTAEVTPQRMTLQITSEGAVVAAGAGEVTLSATDGLRAVVVPVDTALTEFTLSPKLFENRFGKEEVFAEVESSIQCDDFEVCAKIFPLPEPQKSIFAPMSPAIFFYIVIFLVAILIGYIALRRPPTPPEKKS